MSIPMPALTPLLVTAGIGWVYYNRIRRSFGRQRWQPYRLGLRLALMTLLLLALGAAAVYVPGALWPVLGGLLGGAVLGLASLRLTAFELTDGQRYYTPNPWIGGALSLLLIGRLAWRFASNGMATPGMAPMSQASPLTLAIGATLVGYYLVSGIGLAMRMRQLAAPTTV